MKKNLKVFSLFALIGGLLGFGGVSAGAQDVVDVQAAETLPTVEVDAIKVEVVNTTAWDPELVISSIYVFGAVVEEGFEFADTVWPGIPLVNDGYEFPWFVKTANIILVGDQGSEQKQTFNLSIAEPGLHTFTIDGSGAYDGNKWKLTSTLGEIGTFKVERYVLTEGYGAGIDGTRTRIWLDRGHYGTTNAFTVLHLGDSLYKPSGYENVGPSNKYLAYYDVPLAELTASPVIKFHKIKDDLTALWNTSTTHTYVAGDSSKLFILPAEDVAETGNTLTLGAVSEKIHAKFFAKVLEGYLSCLPSVDNGYGAFATMNNHFIPRTTNDEGDEIWNMEGFLDVETLVDYSGAGVEGYSASRGTLETGAATVNAQDKYNRLEAMYTLNNGTGPTLRTINNHNNNALLIIIIAVIGVTAIAGTYFLKSKKEN